MTPNETVPAQAQDVTPPAVLSVSETAPASPPVPAAKSQPLNAMVDVPLLGGRTAVLRRATGRDFQNANRLAGDDNTLLGMALASAVTSIDNRPLAWDDFLAMDLTDCYAITSAYNTLMGN